MKVLVTGGAGFIGSHLVEQLVYWGHDVVVFDKVSLRRARNLADVKDKIEFVKGDVRDFDDVSKAMKGVEKVYHLAAAVSVPLSVKKPHLFFSVNVDGTKTALEAAAQNRVKRFVFISTAAVYGNCLEIPIKETCELKPLSPYGESKVLAEAECQKYENVFVVSILRCFNVYGPRQKRNSRYSGVISNFIENINDKKPLAIFGDGKQTRDFVFVKDVVEAIVTAPEGTFNVGSGKATSILDLIRILEKITGRKIKTEFKRGRQSDIRRSVADTSKLNFKPNYTLPDGLRLLIDKNTKVSEV